MRLKQCIFALVAMLLCAFSANAQESVVAKIGNVEYTTFASAMAAANAATEDVTVEVYGAVEFVDGMELDGSYTAITFTGKSDDAKITIKQTAGGDYLTAHGKTVAFNDLILAKANPAWSGNSGHMGNYFSIQGGTVTYTDCTFPNGACTSGGTATYDNCTFQNASEYGLWVYDDALVTVNGGTIDSTKGIKVYSEDEQSVTSTLTVKNATFTANVSAKPAVAVGYAQSITLIGNTYNNTTAHVELDSGSDADCEGITFVAQDSEGNDISSELTVVDRSKSSAACGVLVDGKIYTTVTTAAAEATSGSTVTLLYNTTETVELPEGVKLDTNGFTADNVTVVTSGVAQVGDTTYATLAEAVAAAQAGDEIKLLANIEGDITVPANVTLNGNGKVISGGIFAEGDITFAGVTTAADFDANVTNTQVNIPAGASLQLTGSARLVIGHGATFNITGTITDAKTADKATLVPSLKIAAGASITGNGVTFNVNNAYIVANANTTSKNNNANGTLDFNINNSIWEQTGVLAFYVPTSGKDPVVNFELKNSVLTTTSHLVFSVTKGEIVFDNSLVNQGTSRQLENRSTMTIKNGSVVNGAVATSSNAINPGTIIVENATYAVTGEFSGAAEGTGTLVIKKGANVSVGSIKAGANVTVDAEGMTASDVINFTANLSQFTGTLSVINNDNLDASIVDGKIVLAVKPVAKIGETAYSTLEDAFKAATSGCTIDILSDVTVDYAWDARNTGAKFTVPVTINGNGKTIKFTGSINDNNWNTVFRFGENATVNNLTVDISNATGAQRVISAQKSLNVDGLKIVGEAKYGVIYGEGASAADLAATEIVVKNSTLDGTRRALSDNEGGKDVKSVVIEGNTFNANVYVSAFESIAFNNNTVTGETDLRSYAADNVLNVQAQGNTLATDKKNYILAKTIEAQTEFVTENPSLKVATKAELQAALAAAKDGDVITLTADIDYGTDQLAITKEITLDLGGKTLTTRNAWGGMSIKGNPTVKNGNIVHASNTAAIKVWNATAFEDLVIDVQGKGDANKTIGGIVLQSGSTTRVGSIKNVTIKGAALTNGIETYNCGDATENVIGSMENVTIDAQGTGLLISAPCGTATNCDIKGGANGIEIWIKGNYSASLDLVDSNVEGGVYAHDEFSSNPSIVNNGTLNFTADAATTGASAEDVTLEIARAEADNVKGVLNDVMENAQAKVNNVYYATLDAAIKAAKAGDNTIELLADCAENVTITQVNGTNIVINGNGKTYTGTITVNGDGASNNLYNTETLTFQNINFTPASGKYAIAAVKNTFARNITVDGCTFKGNNDVYGIDVRHGYNYTVKNTTAEGVYTFLNARNALTGLTVENVTVKCANVAFAGAYGFGDASFKNVTVESDSNGVKVNNPNGSALTFENCSITAKTPVTFIESAGFASALTAEFNGTNNMVVSDGGTYWFNIVEADGVDATFKAIVNDAALDMSNTAFAASVGNVYYSNLTAAVNAAVDGDVVVVARDIELDAANCVTNSDGYSVFVNVAGKAITIDLNGKAITANLSADQFASAKSSLLMAVFSVDTDGNLTLNDGKGTGKVAVTANDASVYSLISNYDKTAKLTINGGSYELDKARATSSLIHSDPSEAVVVNGGNFYLGNVNTGANGSPWIFNVNGNNTGHVTVNGGTFNYDVNHQYWVFEVHVDKTLALKDNGNGTWTVVPAVAYVNEKNGDYTHEAGYATLAEAISAAQAGETVKVFEGTYAVPAMKAGITIEGVGNVLLEGTLSGTLENLTLKNLHIKGGNAQRWAYAKGNLLFENVTFEATSVYALHFDGITEGTNLTYKNCTIIGWAALGGSPASCVFDGCTIKDNGAYGVIRTYFDTTIENCTFDVANANTTDVYEDGIHAVEGANVVVDNCTNVNGEMKDLVNVSGASVVSVDGVEIKNVAQVGETKYTDLQEAIKAAAPAGTVELLSDVSVDEWIMFSETLSISNGDIITTQINGLTINGNGKTVTIKDIESAGNGARLFYDATNLNINNLTFNFVDNAANLGGIGLTAGTIKNVTFNGGGYAIFPGTGAVTIEGCTFKTNATSIYYEEARDNLVVTGNTFENPDNVNVILLRGNTTFTDNNVISGRTVNVVSGSPVVTGNNFNDVRFKVYNVATATIEENTINTLAFNDESVVNSTFDSNTLSAEAQAVLDAANFPAAVAKVGDVEYATLNEAVAAVEDGGTITMIANETFTENNRYYNGGWWDGLGYSGDKSFTIDLNNFTISQDGALNDYLMWFKNDGAKDNTITLKNGTLDAGTTAYCALATASSNAKKITVNLENISLINNNSNGSTVKVRGGAVLNVKDGTVITGKDSYLGVECSAATVNIYDGAEIYMNGTSSYNGCLAGAGGNGTINVYGGYGKGAKGGFIAMTSGGTINIEGGEWIANTDGSIGNNSNVYVLTAQSNINEQGFVGPAIINVTGGTFRGGMDAWVLNNHKDEKAELNISGGNFNANPATYLAQNYVAVENNGVWNVELAAAKIGEQGYATLADALAAAQAENLTDVVITIIGENTVATADKFNLYMASVFNKVTFKQENGNKPYYFEELYTGSRTDNGQFVFDGVNLVVTGQGQYIFEGNVVLSNNSLIKSTAEANCFVYNAEVTVEAGSKIDGVIEDIRGGSLIIDGGKTDGTYCETPGLRDAILTVRWADSNLVLRNGAYVKINSANEVGRLTVTGTLDVTNSKLDSYQWIEVNGSMKLNAGSLITTQQVKGAGNITIDATGMVAGDVVNLTADLSGFTGELSVINNDKLEAQIVDGKIVLVAVIKPVAKIGDVEYTSLQAAVEAAQAGKTVVVLENVELSTPVVVAADKELTLDLNGKTVTYTSAVAGEDMITNRGNLTITDSSDAKTGKLAYVNTDTTASNVTVSTISTEPGSTLVVDGGTIENKTVKADGSSIYSFAIDILTNGSLGDVNVTINGGTVYSDYMAIRQFNNGTACKNSLTINDGYIYGAKRAVQVHLNNNAAVTAIKGGKVEAGEGGYAICNFAATSDLAVTGGEFIGTVYSARENFISGGIYDAEVYAGYCADGYLCEANSDGTYGIVEAPKAPEVVDGKIEFVDGEFDMYTNDTDIENVEITYKRTIDSDWNALYVPFAIPASELLADFDIAYINDVRETDADDDGELDGWQMELIKIKKETAVLRANHPYFVRSKSADYTENNLSLTLTTTLYKATVAEVNCSSMYSTYTIKGLNELRASTEFGDADRVLGYDNGETTWGKMADGYSLKPFRFYLTITNHDGSPVGSSAQMSIVVRDEDGTTGIDGIYGDESGETVIFDLYGRRVLEPEKGNIYIINGKKVMVK